jgi:hypothetical protein
LVVSSSSEQIVVEVEAFLCELVSCLLIAYSSMLKDENIIKGYVSISF